MAQRRFQLASGAAKAELLTFAVRSRYEDWKKVVDSSIRLRDLRAASKTFVHHS